MAPPEMPRYQFQGLNLDMAVAMRKTMRLEHRPILTVYMQVYHLSDDILSELAEKQPASLTALASEPIFPPRWKGKYVNVDLILPDKTVLYLGCVLDRELTGDMRRYRLANDLLKLHHQKIQTEDILTIRREGWICAIPMMSDELSTPILTEAVKRYFANFVPKLGKVPLVWLNDEHPDLAHEVEEKLRQKATLAVDPKFGLNTLAYEQVIERLLSDRNKE